MRWRTTVDRAVAPLGLTHAQYAVLASLAGMTQAGESPSQRALADHTGLEPIYVSKLIGALDSAGLVSRSRDPNDSRAMRLALTPRGSEVASEAIGVVARLHQELLAPLGGTDTPRARSFARTLAALLDAATDTTGDRP